MTPDFLYLHLREQNKVSCSLVVGVECVLGLLVGIQLPLVPYAWYRSRYGCKRFDTLIDLELERSFRIRLPSKLTLRTAGELAC